MFIRIFLKKLKCGKYEDSFESVQFIGPHFTLSNPNFNYMYFFGLNLQTIVCKIFNSMCIRTKSSFFICLWNKKVPLEGDHFSKKKKTTWQRKDSNTIITFARGLMENIKYHSLPCKSTRIFVESGSEFHQYVAHKHRLLKFNLHLFFMTNWIVFVLRSEL